MVAAAVAPANAAPATATPAELAPLVGAGARTAIADHYVVVLREAAADRAVSRATAKGITIKQRYRHAGNGYAATLTAAQLVAVRADPDVDYVAVDQVVYPDADQAPAPWGLDRVDQRTLPLNSLYRHHANGAGVDAYIVDSGIRATHREFDGRVRPGFTVVATDGAPTTARATARTSRVPSAVPPTGWRSGST